MLRFILKRTVSDRHSGLQSEHFETVDIDVPELQALLLRGGSGMDEYDFTQLVGVEIKDTP